MTLLWSGDSHHRLELVQSEEEELLRLLLLRIMSMSL